MGCVSLHHVELILDSGDPGRKSQGLMTAVITRSKKNTFLFFTHSYFELESSGLRDEIRYHYVHNGRPRTEALPYRLADGQWHKVALSVSASHLLLHIDCNRYVLAFLL